MEAPGREPRVVDVQVTPLLDAHGALIGVSMTFADASRVQELQSINEELCERSDSLNHVIRVCLSGKPSW
jgi:hypothetical protein